MLLRSIIELKENKKTPISMFNFSYLFHNRRFVYEYLSIDKV